jgi:hypothetical protein
MHNRTFVDYMYPIADAFRATPNAPLVHVATATELHATRVIDPVVGDVISCAELVTRDRACWQDADAKYPPRDAYAMTPAERTQMRAARSTCAVRRPVLLRVCRVGSVRAG